MSSDNEENSEEFSSDHSLLLDQQLSNYCESISSPKMSLEYINNNESKSDETNYDFNAFIFNWVPNYDNQVKILKESLESLRNNVQVYEHLNEEELLKVVQHLSSINFELYNYICIVILDNQCEYGQFIQTSDKVYVLLESEILTQIKTNSKLKDVKRLFVIQKLLDIRDVDDKELDHITEMIRQRKLKTKVANTLYFGLSKTITANEYTENYEDSPFLEVFSQKFRDHARTKTMSDIFNSIRRDINSRGYQMNIEDCGNEVPSSDLIYGEAISTCVLRDFFELN